VAGQVKKTQGRYLSHDELVASGMVGLVQAASRFDPGRGISFAAYSYRRIRGAILDGIRDTGWYSRYDVARFREARARGHQLGQPAGDGHVKAETSSEISTVHVTSLDFIHARAEEGCAVSEDALHLTDERVPTPDEVLERKERCLRLRRAVEALPERERSLIEGHYFRGQEMQEAGAAMDFSKFSTSRLHARALRMLRALLVDATDGAP
jgi:RNA polymerase sigma factor for flagellar operon FliA